MDQKTLKIIIALMILIILFIVVFKFVSWLAYKLLPITLLICAGFIIYKLVKK
ncbi:hypothetical protein Clocl_1577 [Acetivibrio clariflavus DSM 19732]|uniref:Uncharacterized protein n=1 Tax=Acetivibrio clariflavus (strain DSM 19732 / NBRC 101661 / EBR45) TaxID=720554 RepID=G8M2U9_ACECE|nr:hypothetical protein Clocl_1577 [Acetivibrio clariflavus DSM 19732]